MSRQKSHRRPRRGAPRNAPKRAPQATDPVELLFATTNANKVRELSELCEDSPVRVLSSSAWSDRTRTKLPDVVEDAPDFIGNALLKAASAARTTGLSALADDSGLVVDALGGAPGIHSARYAGDPRDDQRNIDKLLAELDGAQSRSAHFICALVLCGEIADGPGCGYTEDGLPWRAFIGRVHGQILSARDGEGGFGYDPVFFSDELHKSFGVASSKAKNAISHRGRAMQRLHTYLATRVSAKRRGPLFIRPVGYNAMVSALCGALERQLRYANKALEASLAIRPQLGSKERAAVSRIHWYALRNLSRLQLALACLEGNSEEVSLDPRQLGPEDASLLICLALADVDPKGEPLTHNLPGEASALAGLLERSPSLKGTIPLKLKMAGKALRAARAHLSRQNQATKSAIQGGAHLDLIDALTIQWNAEDAAMALQYLNQQGPPTLRVNGARATTDEVIREVSSYGVTALPLPELPRALVCLDTARLTTSELFHSGGFEMQDAGSQRLVMIAAPQPGERVADWCAGAGGKTLAIAEAVGEDGELWALDVHQGRLTECKRRLRRAGFKATVRAHKDDPKTDQGMGSFDLVFVDAPCSSTGALRRTPELRWHIDQSWLGRFPEQQLSIALRAAARVRPGGRLVYATCSIMRAENEGVVERALAELPGWVLEREERVGPAAPEWLHTRPLSAIGPDGFYAAVLRRPEQEQA